MRRTGFPFYPAPELPPYPRLTAQNQIHPYSESYVPYAQILESQPHRFELRSEVPSARRFYYISFRFPSELYWKRNRFVLRKTVPKTHAIRRISPYIHALSPAGTHVFPPD